MGYVLSRGPRFALIIVAALVALATWVGSATAAIPPGDSIGTAKTQTSWQGQYYATATRPDPFVCPPAASDPGNSLCDHFELDVQNRGDVTVRIDWPSPNCATNPTRFDPVTGAPLGPCQGSSDDDFDLYVYDANNMLVASSVTPNPAFETAFEEVTFAATPQTYEVRVVPFDVNFSDYQGTATFAPPPPPPGGGGAGGGIDPPLSVSDASIAEGDSGLSAATFNVTLGWPTSVPVTVNYVTADVSARGTAGVGQDYLPVTGSVVIPAGETRTSFSVPVVADTSLEPNETFLVNLYLPDPPLVVAKIQDGQGVGTIRNDDTAHRVRGGGTLLGLSGSASFVLSVYDTNRGRISYRDGSASRFWATSFTSTTFVDLTHSATIRGDGVNNGHAVTYVLDVADNGPAGTLDSFTLALSDGTRVSGILTGGDIQYMSG
jgi:hypothetical protein